MSSHPCACVTMPARAVRLPGHVCRTVGMVRDNRLGALRRVTAASPVNNGQPPG